MGSYKAYDSYVASNMSEEELLLAENVEALSSSGESGNYTVFYCRTMMAIDQSWPGPLGVAKCHICSNGHESYSDVGMQIVKKWGTPKCTTKGTYYPSLSSSSVRGYCAEKI